MTSLSSNNNTLLSKSRLSLYFFPNTSNLSFPQITFSNFINTDFINEGKSLYKIGQFEPNLLLSYPSTKNSKSQYLPMSKDTENLTMLSNYNINKYNSISNMLINSNSFNNKGTYNKNMFGKCDSFYDKNIHSKLRNLQENGYIRVKRRRFITHQKYKNKTRYGNNNCCYNNSNNNNNDALKGEDGNSNKDFLNKYKIEANKMTKKLIEDNLLNKNNYLYNNNNTYNTPQTNEQNNIFDKKENNNNSIIKEETSIYDNNINTSTNQNKKHSPLLTCSNPIPSNNSLIYIEDKISSINYSYLLNSFTLPPDDSFSFNNPTLLNKYISYKKTTTSDLQSPSFQLSFGEDPLSQFQNWLTWMNQEHTKDKLHQSKELCDDIARTLNSISNIMSSFPIFMFPNKDNKNSFNYSINDQSIKKSENGLNNKINIELNEKRFCCEFCNETFTNGQGLGGHMSRKHKDKSLKFKHKKEVRNKREPLRNILIQAKKDLCKNHLLDYDEQVKTKNGKKLVKSLILENHEEFKKLKNELKKNYCIIINNSANKNKDEFKKETNHINLREDNNSN